MIHTLHNFNARPSDLKNALDADVSMLFKDIFSLLGQNPIDKRQQSLLDEVKKLAHGLKHTVLDKNGQKIASKGDEETQLFLLNVIKNEIHKDLPSIVERIKGDLTADSKHIKQPQNNIHKTKDTDEIASRSITELKNDAVMTATQENIDAKKKAATKIRTLFKKGLSNKKAVSTTNKQPTTVEKHIAQTTAEIVEKKRPATNMNPVYGNVLKGKSKLIADSNYIKHHQNDIHTPKDTDEIASRSIREHKNVASGDRTTTQENIDTKKIADDKVRLVFEKQLSNKKKGTLTKKQPANIGTLISQANTKIAGREKPAKNDTIRFGDIVSEQIKHFIREKESIHQVRNKKTGIDRKGIENNPVETKKLTAPARATAKFHQKLDETFNRSDKGITPKQNNPPVIERGQTIQNQTDQIQDQQDQTPVTTQKSSPNTIPEELQTAVQWMAQEEVENKLVEVLTRQARLRGVDLS
ncbi:hypothetical protein [Desulfobacula sp.]|uniref:hypothetical protein n=1 Tax=Desulfobacula sp. TaxID=2593537 RepID=UPI00262633FE|nr:hypothetical protein [Desulfobacula sp.]